MAKTTTKAVGKTRTWTIIIYPESAPANWKEIIEKTGIRATLSPIHDKDLNEVDGEFKKAHYHLLCYWDNPTTEKNVINVLCEPLNAPKPERIISVKGAYEYLTHKNNPEKYQYEEKDRKHFNGFNINAFKTIDKDQSLAIKKELAIFVNSNKNIREYQDLVMLTITNENFGDDYFEVVANNTIFFDKLLKANCFAPRGASKTTKQQEERARSELQKD